MLTGCVPFMQLLQASPAAPLDPAPLWRRADLSTAEVLAEYHRECGLVRRGIDADLGKVCGSLPSLWTLPGAVAASGSNTCWWLQIGHQLASLPSLIPMLACRVPDAVRPGWQVLHHRGPAPRPWQVSGLPPVLSLWC